MADIENHIFTIGQAIEILQSAVSTKTPLAELDQSEQIILSTARSLYLTYCKVATKTSPNHLITDGGLPTFFKISPTSELQDIIDFLSTTHQEETTPIKKVETPKKEDSTVPAELETLVAQYKESQADKIEADENHTVADAIKRARKTWEQRNRTRIIRENRLSKITEESERQKATEAEDLKQNEFLIRNVDPKAESASTVYRHTYRLARQAVDAQARSLGVKLTNSEASLSADEITYLALAGSLDLSNLHDLSIATQLTFTDQEIDFDNTSLKAIDTAVQSWQREIDTNPYSDKPEEIDQEILTADKKAETDLSQSVAAFENEIKQNLDLDTDLEAAAKELDRLQTALIKAIPNAKLPPKDLTPLQRYGSELEKTLRQIDPSIIGSPLLINPEGQGARTVAVLQTTGGNTRQISPEAVRLYSLGLTPEKLSRVEDFAKSHPNSPIGKLYGLHNNVFQQVRYQLQRVHESKLGQEIQHGLKPLSNISTSITNFYNRLPPGVQGAAKMVLDPRGTVRTWINRQVGRKIGQELLKNTGSFLSQKLGNYLLSEGLKEGVKKFAAEAAKKLAIEAAKKAGITLVGDGLIASIALALGIPTAGLSLIIAAILLVIQVSLDILKKGLNKIWEQMGWGEFHWRDLAAPAVIAGGGAIAIGAASLTGLLAFMRATRIAVVSAVGIIVGAIVVILAYLALAFLTAPILSTLVQLDSLEKVKYAEYAAQVEISPGCPSDWPVRGSYKITQGPGGGYSHYNPGYDQSVDIGTPMGTTIYSTSDGTVSFAGLSAPYLSTDVVIVDSKLPDGTAFQVVYAHLSFMKVSQGQSVKVGDVIGSSGTAGSGPHLHYEYKGIKYNQCPAGGIQLAENCPRGTVSGQNNKCVSETTGPFIYTN